MDSDSTFDPDEPFTIPIEESIDLHPFPPEEIRDVALEYLQAAREKGFREVRLIHGRGKGVQRGILHQLLAGLEFVESFRDADAHRGATIVVFREGSGS